MAVKDGGLYWFQISNQFQTAACTVPIDSVETTLFHAAISISGDAPSIARFDVTLAEQSGSWLRSAVNDVGAIAARSSDIADLIPGRNESGRTLGLARQDSPPLALAVVGSVLARQSRWDRIGEWLKDVVELAPHITDAAVIWAEKNRWQPETRIIEVLLYFMLLDTGTLPVLSDTIGMALRQAEHFGTVRTLPAAFTAAVERVHVRLRRAVGTFRTGGLFSSFLGDPSQVVPEIIAAPAVKDRFRMLLSKAALKSERPKPNVEVPEIEPASNKDLPMAYKEARELSNLSSTTAAAIEAGGSGIDS